MEKIKILEDKYIELLLKRCIGVDKIKDLLINLDLKEHIPFAERVKQRAYELGVENVDILVLDIDDLHQALSNNSLDDISLDNPKIKDLLDKSKWSEYALKHGGILFLMTEVPGLMNDIKPEKNKKRMDEGKKTNEYYRDNIDSGSFNWTIAGLPNQRWAEAIFPNDKDAYEKLYGAILESCMIDKDDPIAAWNDFLSSTEEIKNKLNNLEITNLYYRNSLGTNLHIGLPKGAKWLTVSKEGKPNSLDNMPSYEIFTSPDYRLTSGIVYSSKPMMLQGAIINNFYIKFENGRAVECYAEEGQRFLEQYIKADEKQTSDERKFNKPDYLGEVAFVEYDSPISNTGIIFKNTLFDENAACHLALGDSFSDAIENGLCMTKEELLKCGLNQAYSHQDFMIGTSDLIVEADTNEGRITIIEDGNFSKILRKRNLSH